MNVIKQFREFSNTKKYSDSDTKKLLRGLEKYIKENELTDPLELDFHLEESKGDKRRKATIVKEFYKWLELPEIERKSVIYTTEYLDVPLLRQIEVAKYLQTPHTKYEVAVHFGRSEQTIQHDLSKLRAGIEIMGSTIKVAETENRDGDKRYKKYETTVHPVFLPLNLSETYLLTVNLLEISKGTTFEQEYRELVARILGQLSPYSLDKICSVDHNKLLPEALKNQFQGEILNTKKDQILHMLKSGEACKAVWLKVNDNEIELNDATVRPGRDTQYLFSAKEKEYKADYLDVIDIILK